MNFNELCKLLCDQIIQTYDGSSQNLVKYIVTSLIEPKTNRFEEIEDLRILELLKRNNNSVKIRHLFNVLGRIRQYKCDLSGKTISFLYIISCNESPKLNDLKLIPTGRHMITKNNPNDNSIIPNPLNLVFNTNSDCSVDNLAQPLVDRIYRLKEIGWLFRKVEEVAGYRPFEMPKTLVFQAFQYALQQELNEFYSLCSSLSSRVDDFTLTKIEVWLYDMRRTLNWMVIICEYCKDKKGCELISSLHEFWSSTGNPNFIKLSERLLKFTIEPLMEFIITFIKTGTVNDPYFEFFISETVEDQWKYSLRKSMIPCIISLKQAEMILSIGSCISFLSYIKGSNLSKSTQFLGLISGLSYLCNEEFEYKLIKIHNLANKHVITSFLNVHNFIEHISAIRKYLLLSQGDFVRHLMDILEPELSKPAKFQQKHTLNIILDTAVRGTNAQFESEMIMQRLSVKLLQWTNNETGWDIFSLDYDLPPPITTVISRQAMLLYLRAFHFLWRFKRIEYTLSSTWVKLMHKSRQFIKLSEMRSILMVCFMTVSSMTTFVQQIQFYLSFEVLMCSWDVLLHKLNTATEMGDLSSAHQIFIQNILVGSFVDDSSVNMMNELISIFDIIINFQTQLDILINETFNNSNKFNIHIIDYKSKFDVYLNTFQNKVKVFLSSLMIRDDLDFLAFRLDLNDFYFTK